MSQNKHQQQQESMAQLLFAQMLALFQFGESRKQIVESDEKSEERVFNRCGSPSLVSQPICFSCLPESQQKPCQPKNSDQQEESSQSDFECEEFKPKAVVSSPVAENNRENNCEARNSAQDGISFDCSERAFDVVDQERESLSAAQFEFIRYFEERVFREINKRTVFTKKHNHNGFMQSIPICVM